MSIAKKAGRQPHRDPDRAQQVARHARSQSASQDKANPWLALADQGSLLLRRDPEGPRHGKQYYLAALSSAFFSPSAPSAFLPFLAFFSFFASRKRPRQRGRQQPRATVQAVGSINGESRKIATNDASCGRSPAVGLTRLTDVANRGSPALLRSAILARPLRCKKYKKVKILQRYGIRRRRWRVGRSCEAAQVVPFVASLASRCSANATGLRERAAGVFCVARAALRAARGRGSAGGQVRERGRDDLAAGGGDVVVGGDGCRECRARRPASAPPSVWVLVASMSPPLATAAPVAESMSDAT